MAYETFTTEDAYDASDCGEPIMLNAASVARMCRDHDASPGEFYDDHSDIEPNGDVDAAILLGWLGY